jgi:hypothetical protein
MELNLNKSVKDSHSRKKCLVNLHFPVGKVKKKMTVSFPFIENILVVIWNKDYGETKEEN